MIPYVFNWNSAGYIKKSKFDVFFQGEIFIQAWGCIWFIIIGYKIILIFSFKEVYFLETLLYNPD